MKTTSFLSKIFQNIDRYSVWEENAVHHFQVFFLFQRYSSFKNMQISQVMASYTSPNFDQIWWRMISQPICLYVVFECLILCSKILLNVLHKTNSTWQQSRFQTSLILKAFLATIGIPFWFLLMVPHVLIYMIQL